MALDGNNKTGFVDVTIPKLEEKSPQYHSWMCNNITISSWLPNSVSKEISASVIYASNATEIWKDLYNRF